MTQASLVTRALLPSLLLMLGGGCAGDTLPTYRCVQSIDGANESGGEIASAGSVAYVAGFATIAVFDLSDASAPRALTSLPMPARVGALAVANGRLVAATSNTLHLFDVSRPEAPVKLGEVGNTPSMSHNALATDGRYAYAGTPSGGVLVFDLASGTPVFVTGSAAGGTQAIADLLLQGDVLYAAGAVQASLVAFDVSQRARPVPQPPLNVGGTVMGLEFSDSALWGISAQVEAARGIRLDVRTPLAPSLSAVSGERCDCYVPFFARQITSAHGHLIAAGYGGNELQAWNHGALAGSLGKRLVPSCAPPAQGIVNVHRVGEVLVATGGSAISFYAP